jgi:6-phosphogluconolactonase (cycloisomerase 2 family)
VDPSGRFLYVPSYLSFQILAYSIDSASGVLTQIPGSPFPAGREPFSAATDVTGRFLYVSNQGGGLSAYTIDAVSGALTEIAGSPFPAGPEPSGVAVHPSGRFVYVSNQTTDTTFEFSIDPVTGGLAQIGATAPIMGAVVSITVEPSGKFAYATDGLAYTIDSATGVLTQIASPPFPLGPIPFSIAAEPSDKFVYVADQSGGVWAFSIDPSTGVLASVTGSPFAAGTTPISVATTGQIR